VHQCTGARVKRKNSVPNAMNKNVLEAARRLVDLYGYFGSWGAVKLFLVGKKGRLQRPTLSSIAHGKRPAPKWLIRLLGIHGPKKYYKNYRRREALLRRWIRRKCNG
jgi:hypothetical protein